MVDIYGPVDYDKIKEKIKAIIDANEFKILIIDPAGNIVSDISLSALRDALKPTRTAPVQELSSQEIPAGGTAEFTVNASQTDGFSALVVTVKATYDSSATQGVRVRYLYSPDGVNFDSPEEAEAAGNYEDIGLVAGGTRIRTILIPILQSYVKIQIVNLDSSYSVVVDAWRVLLR